MSFTDIFLRFFSFLLLLYGQKDHKTCNLENKEVIIYQSMYLDVISLGHIEINHWYIPSGSFKR